MSSLETFGWILLAGVFWDFVTSLLGIVGILGVTDLKIEYFLVYISAIVGSGLILWLSANSRAIWSKSADDFQRDVLRPFHIVAVIFDAYTSYLGTAQTILLRNSRTAFITIGFGEVWQKTTFEQKMILLLITALVTLSPIAWSRLRR
ncbi:hypothetical protein QUB08_09725 [Microcoleus sp. BR0-C5]|uniref:hypothetical protein n=1 Tax=Microcoleus sp. BR0-C5 TaxID=2818713 RepID=UPI002FD03B17